jgi:hypothetical protein
VTFAEVDALHVVAGEWTGERLLVEHPGLEAFSHLAGKFGTALGESAEEGYWGPVVRTLKRARWDAATTPLPFSSAATGLAEAAREAVPRLRQGGRVAPELGGAAEDLAERLTDLASSQDDPLGEIVRRVLASRVNAPAIDVDDADGERRDIAEPGRREDERGVIAGTEGGPPPEEGHAPWIQVVAVLLRSGRYREEVEAAVSGLGTPVSVLTPSEFVASAPLDLVAVVGPSAWFPAAVVRASRARRMVFVYPSWIRDAEPQVGLLAGSPQRSRPSHISRAPAREAVPFDEELPLALAEEWVPKADWQAISAAGRRRAGDDASSDPVHAWLFALASGDGVYLEAGEGSRAYVIELEDDLSIHQELTSQIEPGHFVVLRTEGEGDYIRAIADSILGSGAHAVREMQAGWKRELANKMAELGARGLRRELERAGALRATDNNIRQWLRPDSIRTRDPADFSAIAAVIGARDRFRELWEGMGVIDSAHRRAGFQVRALLVEEILRGDRSQITAQGWADFDVEEIEGEGALRVARVEARAPEAQRVPHARTRRPFPIGRDLWLG